MKVAKPLDIPSLKRTAQALQERRSQRRGSTFPRDFRSALAEVWVLASYGKELTEDDLSRSGRTISALPVDNEGRTVRIVSRDFLPMAVWSRRLDADAYVFVRTNGDIPVLLGWLPLSRVEEAPIEWKEEDGQRVDFAHLIEADVMADMPNGFSFQEPCSHHIGGEVGAVWVEGMHDGWWCCGCGKIIHDSALRERLVLDRPRHPVVAPQPEPECEVPVLSGWPQPLVRRKSRSGDVDPELPSLF